MLLPAIGLAPAPVAPVAVVVGPRIWAWYAWLFVAGALILTAASVLASRGNPLFLLQITFFALLDLAAGFNVLRFTVPWRMEADPTGVRKVVAGRGRKVLPWRRVRTIRYGVRRRAVVSTGYGDTFYRAAGFVEIQDRRRWRTLYADSVYYSVSTKQLASFMQYVIRQANRQDVKLAYEETGFLWDEL